MTHCQDLPNLQKSNMNTYKVVKQRNEGIQSDSLYKASIKVTPKSAKEKTIEKNFPDKRIYKISQQNI